MGQHVYWHAPLWELLLVALMSLALLGWLILRAARRPDPSAALEAVHPALNDHPLFFFDQVQGILCLTKAARLTLHRLQTSEPQILLNTLTETLLEAYEEGRVTRQPDWPESNHTLVAVPIFGQPDTVIGVLAQVTPELLPPPSDRLVDEALAGEREAWVTLGPALRLHSTRPLVRVKRICGSETKKPAATWQEYQLSQMEATLLRYMLEHKAERQTLEMLFSIVWPDDPVEQYGLRPDQKDRLRRLIFQLRQHVEPDPRNPRYVCTAHGMGYVLYLEQEPNIL